MTAPPSVERAVAAAREDPARVLVPGVHALKHAIRFGAEVELVVTPAADLLAALLADLAPDVVVPVAPTEVDEGTWQGLGGDRIPTPALTVARRPQVDVPAALAGPGRALLLEDPVHLGNIGAVIRVAAAAGLAAVLVTGRSDPWHPIAVSGAAGLQFAVPVAQVPAVPATDRPVVAVTPDGEPLPDVALPPRALLALGAERRGLGAATLARADRLVAIPMRAGVSSLNLATAAAIVAYHGPDGSLEARA